MNAIKPARPTRKDQNLPWTFKDVSSITKFLTPLLVFLLICVVFNKYVYELIMADLYIVGAINIYAFFTIGIMMDRMMMGQSDIRILTKFDNMVSAGGDMEAIIREPWLYNRPIRTFLEAITHTSGTMVSQMDQTAIANELKALDGEYRTRAALPRVLSGIVILLGLLGTVLGMIHAMGGIAMSINSFSASTGDIQETAKELIKSLGLPFAAISSAFSASLFGLIWTIILGIMLVSLHHMRDVVQRKARGIVHRHVRRTKNESNALVIAGDMPVGDDDADPIFSNALPAVANDPSGLEAVIERAIEMNAQRQQEAFTSAIGHLSASLEQMMGQLINEQNRTFETMQAMVASAPSMGGGGSYAAAPAFSGGENSGMAMVGGSRQLKAISDMMQEGDHKFSALLAQIENLDRYIKDLPERMGQVGDNISVFSQGVVQSFGRVEAIHERTEATMAGVAEILKNNLTQQRLGTERVGEMVSLNRGVSESMQVIKENFIVSNESLNSISGLAADISKLVDLLTVTTKSQAQLSQDLQSSISEQLRIQREVAKAMGAKID
jgi:hypothetical protein